MIQYEYMTDKTPWLTNHWEPINFPMISVTDNKWSNRNRTLSGLKALLRQEELVQYQDYIIQVNEEHKDYRILTVRFREEGQGLICLIKWIGSDFYKGK